MKRQPLLLVLALPLWSASTLWAQNSKRKGFSPEDQKKFDEAVSAGDFYLYLAMGLIIVGAIVLAFGIWYKMTRKKKVKK